MPLDVLGRTRATLTGPASAPLAGRPGKRKSSACADYVPALCTHRPSLLPIEWLSEAAGKLSKLGHLEEVKVVTRSPLVNQRRDHYRVPRTPGPYVNARARRCLGGSAPPGARRRSDDHAKT
ncbi:hypothetical protein XA68_17621 [Ophiocordyceps unilateralis]|uniref:Uncharacterized protein n=1 Tax=Ophiocordyceps unilateralis TaxID=268505 RepID=A0A2A9P2S7_OPHUN|nr:hypothetical protein XA68_17621 [Ophiocordyceps unilateralis]